MKNESKTQGIGRRQFLNRGGVSLLGLAVPGLMNAQSPEQDNGALMGLNFKQDAKDTYKDMLHQALQYRKIDAHNHVDELTRNAQDIVRSCDRVGIAHTAVSIPNGKNPQEIRENNNIVLKAMKGYPNRILGQCYINPSFKKESLEEINRCIGEGMVMLGELYNAVKINDPLYYPIIEK